MVSVGQSTYYSPAFGDIVDIPRTDTLPIFSLNLGVTHVLLFNTSIFPSEEHLPDFS